MSNQLDKNGLPCIQEGENQLTDGLPTVNYEEKITQEDVNKVK